MTINNLNSVDTIALSDLWAIFSQSAGDDRKVSGSALLALIQANLTASGYTTQRASPSATAFSVQITDGSADIHLILTPGATYATGTLVLPAVANLVDKQEILVNCTQVVTALTIDGNGAIAVTGAPTAFAANGYFRLKYDLSSQTWYRVG
jgi:hypothetical protein